MRLSPGTVLARRYQLTASLGEGGMGEVWAARHVLTGKAVAVKLLIHAAHERGFREARARFALEARSACAVEHPNVVEIFDFVESDEPAPFIVMELLQGETLAGRLARGPLDSAREACRLLLPVFSAVGTAHERGIVHRDLKPSNIFLGARPGEGERLKVKVLDFGIAKWFAGDEPGLRTRTGSTLGTPSYMAPEQATGDRSADHRVDVWSLGVILYEAISGVRPLEGENAAQLVMRLLSTGIMPIEQLAPEIEPELGALIGRMLSRDVARRPADLREPFELLRRLAGEDSVAFGAPGTLGVSLAGADVPTGASVVAPTRTGVDALAATEPPGLATARTSGASAAPASGVASGTPAVATLEPASPPTHASFETTALSAGIVSPSRRRARALGALAAVAIATLGVTAALTSRHDATAPHAPSSDAPLLGGGSPPAPQTERGSTPPTLAAANVASVSAPGADLAPLSSTPVKAAPLKAAPAPRATAPSAHRPRIRRNSRAAAPAATSTPPPEPIRNKPKGIECESSAECRSKLCVAYVCQ